MVFDEIPGLGNWVGIRFRLFGNLGLVSFPLCSELGCQPRPKVSRPNSTPSRWNEPLDFGFQCSRPTPSPWGLNLILGFSTGSERGPAADPPGPRGWKGCLPYGTSFSTPPSFPVDPLSPAFLLLFSLTLARRSMWSAGTVLLGYGRTVMHPRRSHGMG